jgi:hypothetical protein
MVIDVAFAILLALAILVVGYVLFCLFSVIVVSSGLGDAIVAGLTPPSRPADMPHWTFYKRELVALLMVWGVGLTTICLLVKLRG